MSRSSPACEALVTLAARGNSIIAELLRLSQHIPEAFTEPSVYEPLLFDFTYLPRIALCEEKISKSAALLELDETFRESHNTILTRFWRLFESMYVYLVDWKKLVSDLETGVYVQQSVESLLDEVEGRQLLAEVIYLSGVQQLLLDMRIPGLVREKMLIAFYRHNRTADIAYIDEVCNLCAATGFTAGGKKPKGYPEAVFGRARMPLHVVKMVLGRLRTDDVYLQLGKYPLPEHRSTAFAAQAALVYVLLYYVPEVLHEQQAVMRELVDRFFPDNWVVPFYMGFTVDLSLRWADYAAARAALANTLQAGAVRALAERHASAVPSLMAALKRLLTDGVLQEQFVMRELNSIMGTARDCNVTLRWLTLHSMSANKKLATLVQPACSPDAILDLLQYTAQFEFQLKAILMHLVATKQVRWDACKSDAAQRMRELSSYFAGKQELTRVSAKADLEQWCATIADRVAALSFADVTLAGRTIAKLIAALEEVEQFHHIDAALHIKEFLGETRKLLRQMLYFVNVREDVLVNLKIVSDAAYAWHALTDYVPLMHARIKQDAETVLRLRAVFLKLASILDMPLMRIQQCASRDLDSVSEHYSSDLVRFVRSVLDIVPVTTFEILADIIKLQSGLLVDVPQRVDKDKLKDLAQLDQRHRLAGLTHAISVFTEGILAMKTTLVGAIEVSPRALLEDGIRKQLVRLMSGFLDSLLVFKPGKAELEPRLAELKRQLSGYRKAFEYAQDYLSLYGLKIWQEEYSRLVGFYVEQEANQFLKKKAFWWDSRYYSEIVPIPSYPPRDTRSVNGIGRLTRELLDITRPEASTYVEKTGTWYNDRGQVIVEPDTIGRMHGALSVFGLRGIDRLLGFMCVNVLQVFARTLQLALSADVCAYCARIEADLLPPGSFPQAERGFAKLYGTALGKLGPLWPLFADTVMRLGHQQLLRRALGVELAYTCRVDSSLLSSTLDGLNAALLMDIQSHYRDPATNPYPSDVNPLLSQLAEYTETAGKANPLLKIYLTSDPIDHLALLTFLYVIHTLPQFLFDTRLDELSYAAKRMPLDGRPFVAGIVTLLHQFHTTHTTKFLQLLGQYVRSCMVEADEAGRKNTAIYSTEVAHTIIFLDMFTAYGGARREDVENFVPPYVMDRLSRGPEAAGGAKAS